MDGRALRRANGLQLKWSQSPRAAAHHDVRQHGGSRHHVETAAFSQQMRRCSQEMEKEHIMVCGTCLDHFQLLDQKKVGQTTNMLDIVTAMQLADKVINI